MKYQSSSIHCSKVISKIKVLKNGSNIKVKVTGSQIMVPTERSYHKEYSCEISKLYLRSRGYKNTILTFLSKQSENA